MCSYTVFSKGKSSLFKSSPHGLGTTPVYFNVTATSHNAGSIKYITADASFLRIYYNTAPALGSNNLSWNWQIKK
ncbi:MAG: hypothetical protein V4685_00965 [Bacteroidota bacterium]